MDQLIETGSQFLTAASNIIRFTALQIGYDIPSFDTTSIASLIVSLCLIYFSLLMFYRTVSYAVRTTIFIVKWGVILYVLGCVAGFILSSGKAGFSWAPVFQLLWASTLKLVGLGLDGHIPSIATDNAGRVLVNGVRVDVPGDYHQYGKAWNKFKKGAVKSKSKSRTEDPPSLAAVLGGLLGTAERVQSVEAIQKGVAQSFDAMKKAVLGAPEPEPQPEEGGWRSWWPFAGEEEPTSRGTKSR